LLSKVPKDTRGVLRASHKDITRIEVLINVMSEFPQFERRYKRDYELKLLSLFEHISEETDLNCQTCPSDFDVFTIKSDRVIDILRESSLDRFSQKIHFIGGTGWGNQDEKEVSEDEAFLM
jgi:hypothetical protein